MDEQGSHALDFVCFPPRWDVSEQTFRPPFFHRNATTEFNGIIRDPAGESAPFYAGGYFLTPPMTPHGIRHRGVERMLKSPPVAPQRLSEASLWFQFETSLPIQLTDWALNSPNRIRDWHQMWGAYRSHFKP
jgi:homogentisate 1,2-dioxygenase